MSNFLDVGTFHRKFDLPHAHDGKPRLISVEEREFRLKFLFEEFEELVKAYEAEDLPAIADALIDLVYVALGTAHYHQLPWERLFAEVQRANLSKERAVHVGQSKRGSTLDVVKPEGWRPPNILEVLMAAGWPGLPLPLK